jgi:iron complex transport system substrate-binding protein
MLRSGQIVCGLCCLCALLLGYARHPTEAQEATRIVTDSAGRRVEVPRTIARVLAAGSPASILLYTLAPEKMIGWVRMPTPAERPFLHESVRELPE